MAKKNTPSVEEFMDALDHPLKDLCHEICDFIKNIDPTIQERIKWNAPSYYTHADFLTLNFTRKEYILLIFHHPSIDHFDSPLFEAQPKGRAMIHLFNREDFETKKPTLQLLILRLLEAMNGTQ